MKEGVRGKLEMKNGIVVIFVIKVYDDCVLFYSVISSTDCCECCKKKKGPIVSVCVGVGVIYQCFTPCQSVQYLIVSV